MFIDSHCHLDMLTTHERQPMRMDDILRSAEQNHVDRMLCVAVNTTDWHEMKALCKPHSKHIIMSAGIHPCNMDDQDFDALEKQASDSQVVAIGESGLDYFYCQEDAIKAKQRHSFAKHIALSASLKKPLIIHTRAARKDTIDIMRSEKADSGQGVMHCFSETLAMAKSALDLGFYISFSGIITFKNADEIRSICQYVPLDRLLIETDSPYLAPVPYRGKVNCPAYVQYVAEQIANIKNMTVEDIAKITSENFYELFKKAKKGL